ncbi:acyl-CoA N-acyltransferase [Striga asiatica]|uniref:Acyl-CoA N-acyltransferase n=1 Tax=Striga asiatica TaxID=4170 RepID=A0A5A7QS68_STRAF|nr:acyl-CoA N-acyltransferase [Striga asiatica]
MCELENLGTESDGLTTEAADRVPKSSGVSGGSVSRQRESAMAVDSRNGCGGLREEVGAEQKGNAIEGVAARALSGSLKISILGKSSQHGPICPHPPELASSGLRVPPSWSTRSLKACRSLLAASSSKLPKEYSVWMFGRFEFMSLLC